MSEMAFSGQSREAKHTNHHNSKPVTAAGKNSLKLVGKMFPPRSKAAPKAACGGMRLWASLDFFSSFFIEEKKKKSRKASFKLAGNQRTKTAPENICLQFYPRKKVEIGKSEFLASW
jgi:hypothetical protein